MTGGSRIAQVATRAAGQASFGPITSVSAAGSDVGEVKVAYGPDGSTTLAWVSSSAGVQVIKAATRAAGSSTFSTPVDLSVGASGQPAAGPEIAIAASGETTVAWHRYNGSINLPQASTRPAGSSTFGAPADIYSGTGQDVALANAPDGTTTVAWMGFDTTQVVQSSTRAAGSGVFGGPVTLSAPGQNAGAAQVAVSPDGAATVVWQRDKGTGDYVIQAATRPAGSSSFGATLDLSNDSQTALQPQLAIAPDGATTVAWYRSNGSVNIVQASTRAAGENTFSTPADLSADGESSQYPMVATSADGTVTAAWQRQSGGFWIVQATTSSATTYTLNAQASGTGKGTISSSPAGINCGSSCSATLALSSVVTLTATPESGSTFSGWGGNCSGSSTTCSITMLGNRSATATFTADTPAPSNKFTIVSSRTSGSSVRTRARVPGAGRLSQRATFSTGGSSSAATRTACTGSKTTKRAATYSIYCKLNSAARKQRKKGRLRVRVTTTYTPTGGTAASASRTVTFSSTKPSYTG